MPKRRRPALRGMVSRQADQTSSSRPGEGGRPARPWLLRSLAGLGWAAGAALVFALFLRISLEKLMTSDGANNALQAWDILHGNLVLHGFILGDVTFYTFELPLIAILEFFLGLHADTMHVAEALIYLIVTAFAVAIAVTDTRGLARVIRASVVVAALAAPTLARSDLWIPLGIPDHTGTTVFLLASFLLIDRATGRRWTAPLLCLILCAGQISDVTVRYVAVPAIAVVAKSAAHIAGLAGFGVDEGCPMLLVEETGTGPDHPFSGEKLSVVLAVYRYTGDISAAAELVNAITAYQGLGHTCGLHTSSDANVERLALATRTARVLVNQNMNEGAGSPRNGLPFTLSLSCGTWGGNITTENVNARHFVNLTWVSRPIEPKVISEETLFAAHWQAHGR